MALGLLKNANNKKEIFPLQLPFKLNISPDGHPLSAWFNVCIHATGDSLSHQLQCGRVLKLTKKC